MELYGKILLIAMPVFLLFVLLEKGYGLWRGKDTYQNLDMISSLSSGITNVVKDVIGLSISLFSYDFLLEHLAIYKIENTFLTIFITFIILDFQGYWVHRWSHEINFFWNKHAVHHSSEEFNLACALRQSISSYVQLFTFFLIPAALLGVPKDTIAIVAPIHLFAQFWYHTRHIGKMGFLENIIVTPSHHRVHHAINPEYLDKNHGQIFIIWDKLFGTFQEELPDVPPVYGITRPVSTWNPIKINFQHLFLLISDAYRTNSWRDKLRIWFMPTGWRPADVEARFPVRKIEDIYHFEKYNTHPSVLLNIWAWIQILATLCFVFYFFGNLGKFSQSEMFTYAGFIFLSVYAYTEIMDKNRWAVLWETLKNGLGLGLLLMSADWFGLTAFYPAYAWCLYIIVAYFVVATLVSFYMVFVDFATQKTTSKAH